MPALLLAGCAQDESLSPTAGDDLPPETYPLQISSLTISGGEEPWTRVAENEDGSVWQPYDAITVSLDGETATYTYDGSAWTSDTPLY